LPPDDHGPAEPLRVSVPGMTREQTPEPDPKHMRSVHQVKAEEDRRRARELREQRERQAEIDKHKEPAEERPKRIASEKTDKSYKTIKSWSTVKSSDQSAVEPMPPALKSKTTIDASPRYKDESPDRKRREVTIMDPKSSKLYDPSSDDEVAQEAFMQEYTYSHGENAHHKHFNEMTDEEKIEYFRDQMKMKPEQIRELTFHPKVTEPKHIHRAYTGLEAGSWRRSRVKSGGRPKSRKVSVYKKVKTVAPAQRKNFVHSRLQGVVYKHINQVYGASPREERERRFFDKLARVQMDDLQRRYEMLAEHDRQTFEARLRQRDQLKRLRKKHEEDSWRRFMTQYVTSKVMESEYSNREEYGLPNELNRSRNPYHARNQRQINTLTPNRRQKVNYKKFSNMFRYNMGPELTPRGRPLKFEGIDTVYIDTEDESGVCLLCKGA